MVLSPYDKIPWDIIELSLITISICIGVMLAFNGCSI